MQSNVAAEEVQMHLFMLRQSGEASERRWRLSGLESYVANTSLSSKYYCETIEMGSI